MAAFAVLRRKSRRGLAARRGPLTLSLGPGAAWLWVAGFAPITATVLIFWMMGFAIWALLRAPMADRWWLQAPVALYAGWLTAAAHVSLGVVLGGYGWLADRGGGAVHPVGARAWRWRCCGASRKRRNMARRSAGR